VKVLLFCGGEGLRLPDHSGVVPKPMITIGYRPILWHVMRFYAHWGLNDFVLCLGYKADVVKSYFLRYNEALSNDFVLSDGGRRVELLNTDIQDWRITFVYTGLHTNIGQRLLAAKPYLEREQVFCANYADNITDAPLPEFVADFKSRGKVAAFLSVRPPFSFHVVGHNEDGLVNRITDAHGSNLWVNGGYFMFRPEIFDFIGEGEDLLAEPFRRLIEADELITYRYPGFWAAMDTLKDLQNLRSLHEGGRPPWAPWLTPPGNTLYRVIGSSLSDQEAGGNQGVGRLGK
jgi:glucose-1-phosphate cytidylyltransferase